MRTLLLLRHAKSAWDVPDRDDFDRPLDQRGQRGALVMAEHLRQQSVVPDAILCSPALRTRETLALLRIRNVWDAQPDSPRALYLASAEALLEQLRDLPDGVGSVLMLGHNPGLHELAVGLVGKTAPGAEEAADSLRQHFPTAALAVLSVALAHWSDLRPRSATLRSYTYPKALV